MIQSEQTTVSNVSCVNPEEMVPQASPSLWSPFELKQAIVELKTALSEGQDLSALPVGHGEPIVFIPTFPWGEVSGNVLKSFLKRLGYCSLTLGIHQFIFSLTLFREILVQRLNQLAAMEGPLVLIGHSVGGLFARDIAAQHPELVRHVITLGMPIMSFSQQPSEQTLQNIPVSWQLPIYENRTLFQELKHRMIAPISVPSTIIWNTQDQTTQPSASVMQSGEQIIEVDSTHLGLIFNWNVFHVIAEVLSNAYFAYDSEKLS
ncbi:alpha/beta hydrolase [Deltaproteobacteria bacterium TL4]